MPSGICKRKRGGRNGRPDDKENMIKLLYLLRHINRPKGEKVHIDYDYLRKAWVAIDHMELKIM